jgi:hypothetical protein
VADLVFNTVKGAFAEIIRDGANIQICVIDAGATTDATYRDHDFLSNVIAASTERTTNGWARKAIANGSVTVTIDDTNDRVDVDIADQTWTGVSSGNSTDLVFAEDLGGADTADRPLSLHDFAITPDGSDVVAQVNVFLRAA